MIMPLQCLSGFLHDLGFLWVCDELARFAVFYWDLLSVCEFCDGWAGFEDLFMVVLAGFWNFLADLNH